MARCCATRQANPRFQHGDANICVGLARRSLHDDCYKGEGLSFQVYRSSWCSRIPHQGRKHSHAQYLVKTLDSTLYPILIILSRAISRDEKNYESPEDFIPERFMGTDGQILDPYLYAFGFGRRYRRHHCDCCITVTDPGELECARGDI